MGREVIILFDISPNSQVQAARNTIAKELREVGARILFADIPPELAGAGINGIDDVAAKFGADKALEIINAAYDPKKKRKTGAQAGLLTEERLAQQFEAAYRGKLHYDHHRGRWYHWDSKQGRWVLNEKRLAFHFAREVCRSLNGEEKKEFARASTYAGVERICQCSPLFAVTSEHWDRDIWLLGVPGGTIDLRTGELREPQADDYITRQTAVAPNFDAASPIFDKFLREITKGDQDLQRYLQRMAGSALTGSTQEQKVFFIFGPGKNGKSVFVNTLVDSAGDYACTAAMETFIEHQYERHSTDIAMLAGARLVTASETQKGRRWNEALIGRLTGGEPITARFMRQNNFTFTAQFSLIIVGNHRPELGSVNEANRRRFSVIPFNFQPEKADAKLAAKLRDERGAILAWAILGARDWYKHGLGETPEVVENETTDYFEEQDHVKEWVDECCSLGENYSEASAVLFQNFESWCRRNGETPGIKKNGLTRILQQPQYGCTRNRDADARKLNGICIKVKYKPDARTGEREEE